MTGDEQVLFHLARISEEASLSVMGLDGILGILFDRETVADAGLLNLTADDVADLYERHIAPAIDAIEDELKEVERA